MDLLLWRHAEAEEATTGQDDLERGLTDKGHHQAERMGRWLRRRLSPDARILVSPARRCQETARGLGRPYETLAALAPEGSVAGLLKAVRWPKSPAPVLVIGHQPTLGETAAELMCGMDLPWSLRRGAVCWLRHRVRETAEEVVLRALVGPDLLDP